MELDMKFFKPRNNRNESKSNFRLFSLFRGKNLFGSIGSVANK